MHIEFTIIAEIVILVLIITSIYFLLSFPRLEMTIERSRKEALLSVIQQAIRNPSTIDQAIKRANRMPLSILVSIIQQFDQTQGNDSRWQTMRKAITAGNMQRLIRKYIQNKNYHQRLWAIKALSLAPSITYESNISMLLRDELLPIRLIAAATAIKIGTKNLINHALDEMSDAKHFSISVFAKIFKQADQKVIDTINHRLAHEKNSKILAVCYHILSNHPKQIISSYALRDIASENKHLKIAVIDAIQFMPQETALPLLLKALEDESTTIKSAVLMVLGAIKAKPAIQKISELLNNRNPWIRKHAVQTLWKLGTEGIKILKQLDPKKDVKIYATAQKVLQLPPDIKKRYCRLIR